MNCNSTKLANFIPFWIISFLGWNFYGLFCYIYILNETPWCLLNVFKLTFAIYFILVMGFMCFFLILIALAIILYLLCLPNIQALLEPLHCLAWWVPSWRAYRYLFSFWASADIRRGVPEVPKKREFVPKVKGDARASQRIHLPKGLSLRLRVSKHPLQQAVLPQPRTILR